MTDKLTREQRRKCMQNVKSSGTKLELALRPVLKRHGFAYQYRVANVQVDFANLARHIIIFVDGCFWHCCPQHFKLPKTNTRFWLVHIAKSVMRDEKTDKLLRGAGWRVIRIWGHAIKGGKNDAQHQRPQPC